jgi:hypothetical protein
VRSNEHISRLLKSGGLIRIIHEPGIRLYSKKEIYFSKIYFPTTTDASGSNGFLRIARLNRYG